MFTPSSARASGCSGPDQSPPDTVPRCECVSTRPGITTLPAVSIVSAPRGTRTAPTGPTATISVPRTTTTPSSIGGPDTGSTLPPANASVRSAAAAGMHSIAAAISAGMTLATETSGFLN